MEKSQPKDTTNTGPGKGYMTGKEVHPGPKKRQDGKGSGKGHGEGHDGLWQHKHSTSQGPVNA